MADVTAMANGSTPVAAPLLFVYRHSAVRSEADDLRDAILLFHPPDTPLDRQCLLAGQLMGVAGFVRSALLSQPAVFDLDDLRLACVHSACGDLTLCVAAPAVSAGSDAAVREAAARLHLALQLACGPLPLAFHSARRHSPELQARLTPLAGRLLDLFCPPCPPGQLGLASGHVPLVNLRPRPHPRRSSRSRLLLAADCFADRLIGCCRGGGVVGCAMFLGGGGGSLLAATNVSARVCAALSVVLGDDSATTSPLMRIDLPRRDDLPSYAFHGFVTADDWPDGDGDGYGDWVFGEGRRRGGCVGLCAGLVPSLASLCRGRFLRLWPLAAPRRVASPPSQQPPPAVRCQCVVWRPAAAAAAADGLCVVALADAAACVACVHQTAAPLMSARQLRPLLDALAATEVVEDDNKTQSESQQLLHCRQLLVAPSAAELGRHFAAAGGAESMAIAAAAADAAGADSSVSALAVRVDGRLRVSAAKSAGLLALSSSVDLSLGASAAADADHSTSLIRRRRFAAAAAAPPRVSVSGVGSVGGFLAPPPPPAVGLTVSPPRRTRSLIGAWRPASRGL